MTSARTERWTRSLVLLLGLTAFLLLVASGPTSSPTVWADEPAAPAAPQAAPRAAPPALSGRLEIVDGQRVLTLWGSPRERGFAQGYLLAEQIVGGLERDFQHLLKPLLPSYEALLKTVVIPRFAFDAREQAELEGLFAGMQARLPKAKRHLAVLGREIELVDLKALNTVGDWYGLGCSSLAVWGELSAGGAPRVGRNFDFPAFSLVLDHQCVVVRGADGTSRGHVGVSYPGCIGTLTGLSTEGVFVAVHDVRIKATLKEAMRANVPRLVAVRRLLERGKADTPCGTFAGWARDWPTLYGNNLIVVGPSSKERPPCAVVLEYDSRLALEGGCTPRTPDGSASDPKAASSACLACTNHHRTRKSPPGLPAAGNHWRYALLACVGTTDRPDKPLDSPALFAWMGRTAFPRGGKLQGRATSLRGAGSQHGTLHQTVAEPNARLLHVRLGRVGAHISKIPHRTYDVRKLVAAATPAKPVTPKRN